MALSPVVEALIAVFEEHSQAARQSTRLSVSRTISTLAAIYEKARNAVEFRADHLIRRAAIERILKRRILLNGGSATIAENLILELLWARYIDTSLVDDAKVEEVQQIINRYLYVKHELSSGPAHNISWDTIMGLASSEIEETLVSARRREALNNFFYQAIRSKIQIPERDEKYINIQTYIAIERAYAQADDALITFHLIKIIQPSWFTLHADAVGKELPLLLQNITLIRQNLVDPQGDALSRYVRKNTPPFLLIRDFFVEAGNTARVTIEDTKKFEEQLAAICAKRYHEIGAKMRRAVVRSIIYIFLTKMLFALALEAPFDLFVLKRVDYIPLAINSLFPPILLFLVAGLIGVPGGDNTKRLIDRVNKIIYHFDQLKDEKDNFLQAQRSRRPGLTAVFSVLYIATFLLSFGCISFALTKLHFSIASQIIFVFFVTLVSFFAYRIRQSSKEYEMIDRSGFLGPVVDFFFLPVLRVGHLLSREIARLNIFIFLFDFILEAPLKVIFEVAEEWIRFVRMKKEEII